MEAEYKFITDIFSHAEHADWALQSFTLYQAICAISQFIWMDAQRTCIWRTVKSSVKVHTLTLALSHTHKRKERERESYIHVELTRYM